MFVINYYGVQMNKFKTLVNNKKNFLIALILIFVGVILTATCCMFDLKTVEIKEQQNIVNTIAQIQMAIAALVVTMMSITTTFLNEKIYGVKLKDIFKLRKGLNLSLLSFIIILMVFTSCSIVSMILNLLYSSLLMLAFTIVICLWISIQDLPLCFKNDKALIRLIKNNKNINVNGLNNSETYNIIVRNLINDKKINKVYELLKIGKDSNLIDYLFNLIISKLTTFKSFDDAQNKIEFDTFADATLENITLLLNNESKVFDDYNNSDKIAVYLARIFYYINIYKHLLDKSTIAKFERVFNSLFWLLFIKEDNIQKDIAFKTYQQLLYWSFRECELWVVRLLKKAYSSWSHTFSNYKLANILFSEISFILFYYYQYENLISKEKKQSIKDFIIEQDVYSSTEIGLSWKKLFEEHLTNYSLTFSDLQKYIDAEKFEYMLVNHCKCCLFSERSLAEWWIKCLFSSSNLYHYNLEFLDNIDEGKDTLSYYLDSLFELNSENIKVDKSFSEFNDFFDIEDKQVEHINLYKNTIQKLYSFKNSCKKQKEAEYISKTNVSKDLEKLREHLQKETINYLDSLGFRDETIDLSDIQARGFYNLEEMFELENAKSLYLDMIKNCFEHDFDNVFEKELSENIITFDDNLKDAELEKCLNINPTFTTEKVMYALESRTNISTALKESLIKMDEKISLINNQSLLQQYCYGNKKSIRFNYEIHTFELKPLPDEEVLKMIDQYKAENGTYFYQGVQYSYNELIDVLKEKLFTMKIYLKYKIIYDKNNLCVFDPWGFYERKKKRKGKKTD